MPQNAQPSATHQGESSVATACGKQEAPYLSVIIPAYNEEERLKESLPRVFDYLSQQEYAWEVIVVDDGSRDSTSAVAQRLGVGPNCRVLRNEPNRGKGYSTRRGMLEAHGKHRLFTDADLSTPMEEIGKFWSYVEAGYAVVIGSRAAKGAALEVRQKLYRELMGRAFNVLVQVFLVGGIRDTQCGFKLFSAEAAECIFRKQTLDGFSFDVELLILARKHGFRIKEAPVRWRNSPASRVSAWRDSIRMFADLLRLRFLRRD